MKKLICLFLVILLTFSILADIFDAKPVEVFSAETAGEAAEKSAPAAQESAEAVSEPKEEVTPFVVGGTKEVVEEAEIEEVKTPVASLEEMNEMLGTHLPHMEAMGGTEESYAIVNDDIAEITFSLNGIPCVARASLNFEKNITGSREGKVGISEDGSHVTYGFCGLEMGFYQFGFDDEQFVFLAYHDGAMDTLDYEIATKDFAETIYEISLPAELVGIAGYYVDSAVKKSYTVVTPVDHEQITFYSAWIQSDEEYQFVTGILRYDNGKLVYDELMVNDQAGTAYPSLTDGYLTYCDGVLTWNGATEEPFCRAVFTKMGPSDVFTQNDNGEWVAVDRSEYEY